MVNTLLDASVICGSGTVRRLHGGDSFWRSSFWCIRTTCAVDRGVRGIGRSWGRSGLGAGVAGERRLGRVRGVVLPGDPRVGGCLRRGGWSLRSLHIVPRRRLAAGRGDRRPPDLSAGGGDRHQRGLRAVHDGSLAARDLAIRKSGHDSGAAGSTAGIPTAGRVGYVTIPATVSGFAAGARSCTSRPQRSYPHPVSLPVIEMMSGQPGSPQDVFEAGRVATSLDAFANAHHGVAPIVVVPDQLGSRASNPMCVDSPFGNSASYLTVDVPRWIRSTFAVDSAPTGWVDRRFLAGGHLLDPTRGGPSGDLRHRARHVG